MKRQARRRSPPASRRSHYQKEMRLRTVIFILIMLMTTAYQTAQGKTRRAQAVATIDGDTLYQVLPPDAIPAIRHPEFAQGDNARRQMSTDEMIIGVEISRVLRLFPVAVGRPRDRQ